MRNNPVHKHSIHRNLPSAQSHGCASAKVEESKLDKLENEWYAEMMQYYRDEAWEENLNPCHYIDYSDWPSGYCINYEEEEPTHDPQPEQNSER